MAGKDLSKVSREYLIVFSGACGIWVGAILVALGFILAKGG
jgi:hypothetical protein